MFIQSSNIIVAHNLVSYLETIEYWMILLIKEFVLGALAVSLLSNLAYAEESIYEDSGHLWSYWYLTLY